MHPESLGQFILAEREKINPSRRDFARSVGLDPGTIEDIESGYTKSPGLKAILAIAEGLKVSPMSLIAVYQGKKPDSTQDDQTYKASAASFIKELPQDFVIQTILERYSDEEILQRLLAAKGKTKFLELLQELDEHK